jgi:hypothetical protein
MSADTEDTAVHKGPPAPEAAKKPEAPKGPPIPFVAFAKGLGPSVAVVAPATRPGQAPRIVVTPGHADEVYLKLLKMRHGRENRTEAEWRKLIDGYRHAPAHPADPNYER